MQAGIKKGHQPYFRIDVLLPDKPIDLHDSVMNHSCISILSFVFFQLLKAFLVLLDPAVDVRTGRF